MREKMRLGAGSRRHTISNNMNYYSYQEQKETEEKIILKCVIKELSSSAEETQSLETEKTRRVLDLIDKEKHSCG